MTPAEQAFFRELAESLFASFIRPLVGSIFYGISFVLSIWAFQLFKTRRPKGWPGRILAVAIISCFILESMVYSGSIATTVSSMKVLAKNGYSVAATDFGFVPSTTQSILDDQVHPVEDHFHFAQYVILAFSDAIVIWRAKVLYQGKAILFVIPGMCLIGSISCLVTGFIFETGLRRDPESEESYRGHIVEDTGLILSFVSNVITTILIMARMWSLRQWFRGHRPDGVFTASAGREKLAILVEAGVAFCIVQAVAIFLNLSIDTDSEPTEGSHTPYILIGRVMNYFHYAFAANYSILVLILVHTKRSPVDNYVIHLEDSAVVSSEAVALTTYHPSIVSD